MHLFDFIIKKSVTMHGHMNVKKIKKRDVTLVLQGGCGVLTPPLPSC